jgi:TnpA family transposase
VMSHVADGLRSGDLYVPGSEKYADYREQLLSWEECTGRLPAYCESMDLPDGAEAFTRQLREHLEAAAERADAAFPVNSELSIDEDGKPHLERMEAERAPDGTGALREAVRENMPERHLLDVLKDTRHWTGYTSRFGPPSGTVPKGPHAEAHHLFTVFGYGCNLGPAQTAQHSRGPGVTLRNLKRINDQHVTTAGLESALEDVIEEYARFELPFLWGSEEVAVADGTHVELVENNLLGERHIRYGGYGGIAYHHISDTYIALFSRFIACGVWEAVYILDGLLENESALQPDTVHADTHGQSEPVFGLAQLLGIQLMPRMRNWNEVTFYRPSSEASYEHIDALFSRVADWDLIEARWKDLMQVALSVQAGTVLPSMLLRKLGTQSRQNQLYRAFRELGRVVRTIFLLEYISTAELRRSIHAATTKIESYNAFSDWLSFGGDVIRSGDPIEQEKRVKYRDLVANAVMLRNVADLTDVLADLKADGHDFAREQVARLSPYMTTHLKRFGQYVLDMDSQPPPLEPKSLDLVDEASPLR